MENVTKGVTTLSPQLGFGEGIMQAQVWDSEGKSIIIVEPTADPAKATNIALLCSDALNTHNTTGLTPSELKEQKRELVEALELILTHCSHVINNEGVRMNATRPFVNAKQLIEKHSKDV